VFGGTKGGSCKKKGKEELAQVSAYTEAESNKKNQGQVMYATSQGKAHSQKKKNKRLEIKIAKVTSGKAI